MMRTQTGELEETTDAVVSDIKLLGAMVSGFLPLSFIAGLFLCSHGSSSDVMDGD